MGALQRGVGLPKILVVKFAFGPTNNWPVRSLTLPLKITSPRYSAPMFPGDETAVDCCFYCGIVLFFHFY